MFPLSGVWIQDSDNGYLMASVVNRLIKKKKKGRHHFIFLAQVNIALWEIPFCQLRRRHTSLFSFLFLVKIILLSHYYLVLSVLPKTLMTIVGSWVGWNNTFLAMWNSSKNIWWQVTVQGDLWIILRREVLFSQHWKMAFAKNGRAKPVPFNC